MMSFLSPFFGMGCSSDTFHSGGIHAIDAHVVKSCPRIGARISRCLINTDVHRAWILARIDLIDGIGDFLKIRTN